VPPIANIPDALLNQAFQATAASTAALDTLLNGGITLSSPRASASRIARSVTTT
jgi:hypothetical protein